ncbi:ArsR family transcriptional regulator [Agromyces protaetiae]|uniref:ArsR family transcriptional regulator n=1 Tax=Agromyces protaetiae TaxID=2509455 RepID=A0A4P6FCI4_9MICO|nr:metalloregulator ArsR/SmtB family transcription factor [Agromyces protaetiae]QAY73366.1 ArsR family transcriptional regulator [Agromyces protaetiae]
MHAFDVLGDPVRRRILEILASGEASAGDVVDIVGGEFGITQPAVSRQLRILRETGFATVRPDGARRLYALDPTGVDEASDLLDRYRARWTGALAALHTEVARGRRMRRGENDRSTP